MPNLGMNILSLMIEKRIIPILLVKVSVLSPDMEVHMLLDEPQYVVEAALNNLTDILSELSNMQVSSL